MVAQPCPDLLLDLGGTSIIGALSHGDIKSIIALQQQDERLETSQAILLGSRNGGHHSRQHAVQQVLAVLLEEVWTLLTDVGHQLVCLLLHCLIPLLPHSTVSAK